MDSNPVAHFTVVVNHEEQYSIWPTGRPIPAGWKDIGFSASKSDCLSHIEEIWTDMRPLSVRLGLGLQET